MNPDDIDRLPPSGSWAGYYVYAYGGGEHEMTLNLTFSADGKLWGDGIDDVALFTIDGSFDGVTREVTWTKSYLDMHSVEYRGLYHQRKISGTWTLTGVYGGFCIWPNSLEQEETTDAEVEQPEEVVFA
jgi:hypothetical protein